MTDWKAGPTFHDPSVTYLDVEAVFCPLDGCNAWPGDGCRTITGWSASLHAPRRKAARLALALPKLTPGSAYCAACGLWVECRRRDGSLTRHTTSEGGDCPGSWTRRAPEARPERAHVVVRADLHEDRWGPNELRILSWVCTCGDGYMTHPGHRRGDEKSERLRAWLAEHGGRVEPPVGVDGQPTSAV